MGEKMGKHSKEKQADVFFFETTVSEPVRDVRKNKQTTNYTRQEAVKLTANKDSYLAFQQETKVVP